MIRPLGVEFEGVAYHLAARGNASRRYLLVAQVGGIF